MSNYASVLGGLVLFYFLIIVFYRLMFKAYTATVDIANSLGQMAGGENSFYMAMNLPDRLEFIGAIIYMGFFILLWRALQKNAQTIGDSKDSQEAEE